MYETLIKTEQIWTVQTFFFTNFDFWERNPLFCIYVLRNTRIFRNVTPVLSEGQVYLFCMLQASYLLY